MIHYLCILFCVVIASISISYYNDQMLAKSEEQNTEYSRYLTTATQSAIAYAYQSGKSNYIFEDENVREETINTFYSSLAGCFNYEHSTYEDMLRTYVPCVILIDTDGYYVQYSQDYRDNEGDISSAEIISPINKWAVTTVCSNGDTFTIEYHLDDTVKVTQENRSGEAATYEGYYYDVYEKIGKPDDLSELNMDIKSYREAKTLYIIRDLEDKIEYYINNNYGFVNQYNTQYTFTLPTSTGGSWARLIDNPTVISFLQGLQEGYPSGLYNVYAFSGAEIEENILYYIKKEELKDGSTIYYYHEKDCNHLTEDSINAQEPVSMHRAAMNGAYPCPDCIK